VVDTLELCIIPEQTGANRRAKTPLQMFAYVHNGTALAAQDMGAPQSNLPTASMYVRYRRRSNSSWW